MTNVRVRVAQSFEGCVAGDEAWVEYTPRVQGLISAGLLQVLADIEAEVDEPVAEPPVTLTGVLWPPPEVPSPEVENEEPHSG